MLSGLVTHSSLNIWPSLATFHLKLESKLRPPRKAELRYIVLICYVVSAISSIELLLQGINN